MKLARMRSINVAFIAAFLLVFKAQSSDFLPHGWTEHSSNGVAYYHNQRTGITQWEKPVEHTSFAQSQQTRPPAQYNLQPSTASSAQEMSAQRVMGSQQLLPIPSADTHDYGDTESKPATNLIDNSTATSELKDNSRTTISGDVVNESTATSSGEFDSIATSEALRSSIDRNDAPTTFHGQELARSSSRDGGCALKSVNVSGDSLDVQDYNAKILIAERKIDDLNDAIDDLEDTKAKLSLRVQSDEEFKANFTSTANATAMSKVRENAITYSELKAQIEILKTSLIERNDELVSLLASKETFRAELVLLKANVSMTGETILELRSNFTSGGEELKASRELLSQQERELADAYKEIGQLEEDIRSVAGPSLKRLRQPSFFARILISAFPVWVGGKGSIKSSRRAKGRAAAALAVEEAAAAMNRTVDLLRENLTSMASTLTSKEAIIEELSEQLVERTEEADMRRDAYVALKEGVDAMNTAKEQLLEEVESRDKGIFELSEQMNAAVAAGSSVAEKLRRAEVTMISAQEIMAAEDAAHMAAMEKLTADVAAARSDKSLREMLVTDLSSSLGKALIIERELKGQVNNVTMHLNDLVMRQQAAAKRIVEESLLSNKNRPWYKFLWPF